MLSIHWELQAHARISLQDEMGSIDKLIKALENLRVFTPEVGEDASTSKYVISYLVKTF